MSSSNLRIPLGLLAVAAFALRLVYCSADTGLGKPIPDHYREYILTGQHLLQHGTIVSPFILGEVPAAPSALLPPAYTALVAGVYKAFGVETVAATLTLQLINILATTLTVLMVFLITRRIAGTTAAWIAAVITTINPTLFGFTTYAWDTSLFALGVALAVRMSQRLASDRTRWHGWLRYGLYLGCLALLNPALTIAYPFLVLWPLTKSRGWRLRQLVGPVALTVLGWLIAITPWTTRNYVHFGELTYVRNGFMLELWLGVCPEADDGSRAVLTNQFPLLSDEAQRRIAAIGERAFIEECGERASAAVAADPWRLIRLSAVRALDYWAGTVYSHRPPGGSGWPTGSARRAVALFLLLESLIILVCFALSRGRNADVRWLLGVVISFSLVYCVTHMQVRFRAPIEPVMAILVAAAVAEATALWHRGRRARIGVGANSGPADA